MLNGNICDMCVVITIRDSVSAWHRYIYTHNIFWPIAQTIEKSEQEEESAKTSTSTYASFGGDVNGKERKYVIERSIKNPLSIEHFDMQNVFCYPIDNIIFGSFVTMSMEIECDSL